jgi:muramoyltetrapeptide carboxypeptidase
MKIRPQALKVGDTVGLVALSSPLKMDRLPMQLEFLESLGLNYKLGKTVAHYEGYLAGTDEERVKDFHDMLRDPEVKAIFCVRGGYGIARIADKISYPLIEDCAKIIWGFSDVTYLHMGIQNYSNLVSFHGPMLTNGKDGLDDLSAKMFQQLFQPIEIQYSEAISSLYTLNAGQIQAELTGGNLRRMTDTIGTKYEADFKNKIVLLEDIGEDLAHIDSMFNQLRLTRKLEHAAGFILGSFTGLGEGETEKDVYNLFNQYTAPFNKPTVAGFRIGHCEPNVAIPLGVEAILDADQKLLRILPGVE